jgi:hypothetical protein
VNEASVVNGTVVSAAQVVALVAVQDVAQAAAGPRAAMSERPS